MAYERDCLALARDVASLGTLMEAEEKTVKLACTWLTLPTCLHCCCLWFTDICWLVYDCLWGLASAKQRYCTWRMRTPLGLQQFRTSWTRVAAFTLQRTRPRYLRWTRLGCWCRYYILTLHLIEMEIAPTMASSWMTQLLRMLAWWSSWIARSWGGSLRKSWTPTWTWFKRFWCAASKPVWPLLWLPSITQRGWETLFEARPCLKNAWFTSVVVCLIGECLLHVACPPSRFDVLRIRWTWSVWQTMRFRSTWKRHQAQKRCPWSSMAGCSWRTKDRRAMSSILANFLLTGLGSWIFANFAHG